MLRPYDPYIPKTIGELMDQLAFMMLSSPTFVDKLGFFPERNIDTAFFQLNEGFQLVRDKLGEEKYQALAALSDRMRALFEADPKDETGDASKGRMLIHEMEDILTNRKKTALKSAH